MQHIHNTGSYSAALFVDARESAKNFCSLGRAKRQRFWRQQFTIIILKQNADRTFVIFIQNMPFSRLRNFISFKRNISDANDCFVEKNRAWSMINFSIMFHDINQPGREKKCLFPPPVLIRY